jgi:molybdate transport system permease protein
MNRAFNIFIAGTAALLIALFLVLLVSMLLELWHQSFVRPPQFSEIFFAARLSLVTATFSSVIAMVVSIPVAYLFSRHSFPGKDFFDTLLDLPIVLSPIALGALLLIFFNTGFGRQIEQWFGPFVFEVKGIVLAQFFVIVGLSLRLLKETFQAIDVEYEKLARTLGYNQLQVFAKVVLPMARGGLLAAFLLTWGRAIGEFGATVTLAGATTMKTETIPVAIYLNFESVDISSAIVFITILIAMSFAVLFFVRKTQTHVL